MPAGPEDQPRSARHSSTAALKSGSSARTAIGGAAGAATGVASQAVDARGAATASGWGAGRRRGRSGRGCAGGAARGRRSRTTRWRRAATRAARARAAGPASGSRSRQAPPSRRRRARACRAPASGGAAGSARRRSRRNGRRAPGELGGEARRRGGEVGLPAASSRSARLPTKTSATPPTASPICAGGAAGCRGCLPITPMPPPARRARARVNRKRSETNSSARTIQPPLPPSLRAGVLAARRALVGEGVVVVAPGDAVGVDEMVGRAPPSPAPTMRAVIGPTMPSSLSGSPKARHQPLQDAHCVGAGVDLHVEDARLQRFGQQVELRLGVVVADVDLGRPGRRRAPDVGGVDAAVAGQVEPEPLHGVDGDAMVSGAAGIVGIVHVAAFAAHDLRRYALDRVHGHSPAICQEGPAA